MTSPLFALLGVVAMGAPVAVVISVMARIDARKLSAPAAGAGPNMRQILVAGSSAAAQQLIRRIQQEPHAGMTVVGLCLPSEEPPRPVADGIPVVGNLDQVAEVARSYGGDAVAVAMTSDDTTRHIYLRKLAWSLEGTDVELLVDPGLDEAVGRRLHVQPHTGFPLIHLQQPHSTGWRPLAKRPAM
jgi:FlaA1/EpsC-like NDP-sugar epimerase